MLDDEQKQQFSDLVMKQIREHNELWKKIRFRQRLSKTVAPSLKNHGFEPFTHVTIKGPSTLCEFSKVESGIVNIVYFDRVKNVVDRYRRATISGKGILGVFRVNVRVLVLESKEDIAPNWLFLRFTPPRNVLPWNGEWPFKDAATLDELLGIFNQEFDLKGDKLFELARSGGSFEELTAFMGKALPLLSEEEWDKSPWGNGDIVVPDESLS